MDHVEADGKLRSLIEAGIALTSEGSLDALLRRLLELAAQLTGAQYAALGVLAPGGAGLERFLTHGVDAATEAAIGAPPQGHGILGALIREAKPLRLHDLSDDPRSAGVPPNHPEMHTFLGVPILLRGVAYGNLYLTEKAGGEDFTARDEELVALLAAQAAVAIENVRLYEAATEWSSRLESLNEVGNALATETDLDTLLDLIARRLREMLGARFVSVFLPSGPDELRFAAVAGEGGEGLVGTTLALAGSKSGRVLAKRRSERLDSVIDDPEVDQVVTRRLGASTGSGCPSSRAGMRSACSPPTTRSLLPTAVSATTTSVSPRRSRAGPRLPSTSRSGSRATLSAGWSPRRSSSAAASRASCTTRPGRRWPRSCSG